MARWEETTWASSDSRLASRAPRLVAQLIVRVEVVARVRRAAPGGALRHARATARVRGEARIGDAALRVVDLGLRAIHHVTRLRAEVVEHGLGAAIRADVANRAVH